MYLFPEEKFMNNKVNFGCNEGCRSKCKSLLPSHSGGNLRVISKMPILQGAVTAPDSGAMVNLNLREEEQQTGLFGYLQGAVVGTPQHV